ncbi:hypothetical protein CUMW_083870, partial [Citrus unshiu]
GSIIFRCGTLGLDSFISIWVLHFCWSRVQLKVPRFCVRASLDTNVSDMSVNAPKGLFLPEPEHYRGPKLKVAIIGAGLAGMSTAVDLLDQGHGTEASLLLMLKGSPDVYLSGPIRKYITDKGGRYATDKKVVQLQVHG